MSFPTKKVEVGLPKTPDYDSGWVALNALDTITITHNLGTTNVLMFWVRDLTGEGIGICPQSAYIGCVLYNLTTTQITCDETAGVDGPIRIKIWKLD